MRKKYQAAIEMRMELRDIGISCGNEKDISGIAKLGILEVIGECRSSLGQ